MEAKNDIREEIQAELAELAPTLSKIEKINAFEVPEGYFDSLPGIIQEQIASDKGVVRRLPIYMNVRAIAVAASIALIAVSFLLFNIQDVENTKLLAFEDIATEEIALLLENSDYIDEEMITESLIEEESSSTDGEVFDETDEIIDYLLDNDIDLSTIINEL